MKILEIISDISNSVVDPTGRTQRQFKVIYRWAQNFFHGTFEACTGFGKTRVGIEAIKLLRRSDPLRTVIVVVPTLPLQAQWRKLLIENKQDVNTEVWVINSLASEPSVQNCSLLICDEIHNYAAETFSKVFNVVVYKHILGLTAIIERTDGKHVLLEKYAPVIDNVPLHVARAKGWVAKYKSYNYGIELPPDEQQEYDVIYGKKSKLMKYMAPFNYDLQTIIMCSVGNKPRYDLVSRRIYTPKPVRIAKLMGWRGNSVSRAAQLVAQNRNAPRGSKVNIWGGDRDHIYHPDRIVGYAVQARRLIAERKKFICNHYLKTEAVIELYHVLNRKTISFTETKEVAKDIHKRIGEKAVLYHSQMDSVAIMVTKTKTYKHQKTVDKYVDKHPEISFEVTEKDGSFIITWRQEKFVGEAFQKREALRKLSDNRYKIDFISSVRALNEGIDFPDLELALIHSRNSTPRDTIQRTGRVARLFIYKDGSNKEPIVVNIYLKHTKDEDWLRKATAKSVGDIWVDSISQILEDAQFIMIA